MAYNLHMLSNVRSSDRDVKVRTLENGRLVFCKILLAKADYASAALDHQQSDMIWQAPCRTKGYCFLVDFLF